jgi:amino acid transporter
MESTKTNNRVRVVVATTVMLSFISFWRAAAIVLNDLASSAYYAGGIAEQAAGKAAPWIILGVMLFSYAVRAVYVESSAMFTRGGVYRVVKEAMGGTLAKFSVSALMFDYVLTGPISGVTAGQYIVGLIASTVTYMGHPWRPSDETVNLMAAGIASLVTMYFWWRNIKGIHESSEDALRIMKVTTVMVVLIILWCGITLIERGPRQTPPLPAPHNLAFDDQDAGWMPSVLPGAFRPLGPDEHDRLAADSAPRVRIIDGASKIIGLIAILMAFGHAILAMSGEESLAQVNRELEHPKHKNLMRAGLIIFIYSLLFTSLVSIFASLLIPDAERPQYFGNLISGLVMNVVGPYYLRLLFQAFVVVVGFLILSGAINTAIVGSNGVLNRLSEDGVLTSWFRAPQRRYGTTYRMINLIVFLQIATIVASRGNIITLGNAYAFGVVWSFAFKALSVLVLRYKDKSQREWKVPGNLRIGGIELPFGLLFITLVLFSVAIVNLFTKQDATIVGGAFTAVLFVVFTVSERINARKTDKSIAGLDQFNLNYEQDVTSQIVRARPGSALVPVRDYNTMTHLEHVLQTTNTEEKDIVVMTVRLIRGPDSGERDLYDESLFTEYEQRLFTRVVALAEKHGKPVELLVVPAKNVSDAVAQTATRIDSAEIVEGASSKTTLQEQARDLGRAWERLPEKPRRQVRFTILGPRGSQSCVLLGAHAPDLTEEDVNLIHKIWLEVAKIPGRQRVHHRDVVRVALERLERDLHGRSDAMLDFYKLEKGSKTQGKEKNGDHHTP